MDEDRCENCWWHYGINGGSCCHESHVNMLEDEYEKPCGWFEPKVKTLDEQSTDADRYEQYQNEWN